MRGGAYTLFIIEKPEEVAEDIVDMLKVDWELHQP